VKTIGSDKVDNLPKENEVENPVEVSYDFDDFDD